MSKRKTKGGLPKFDTGGSLFQGSALPSVTSTVETQATAPTFYTNYLQDIANLGKNAVGQGGVAGLSPLQQQAFAMAPCVAFSGAGSAGAGAQLLGEAGKTIAPQVVGCYLNPYTCAVVNNMARLQKQNVEENVLPALNAAGASTGQFGSQRQLQATGNTLRDLQANLLGQQAQALSCGYKQATTAAQTDLSRALSAGQGLGNIASQQYNIGTGGLGILSNLGAACRAQAQAELCYPIEQATKFAGLLRGYCIPKGGVQQTCGPLPGAYSNSPLSQIAGLGTLLAALCKTPAININAGKAHGGSVNYAAGGAVCTKFHQTSVGKMLGAKPGDVLVHIEHHGQIKAHGGKPVLAYHDGKGNVYDVNGNKMR